MIILSQIYPTVKGKADNMFLFGMRMVCGKDIMPMDIEWAVSGDKVYILQARPITTLRRLDIDTYSVNGSLSGYKMLTRTNIGEIFMKPVSPIPFSILEKINDLLGSRNGWIISAVSHI